MSFLIPILTTIIGSVTRKGPNAKANAGGLVGALMMGGAPLFNQFSEGVLQGAGTSVRDLGIAVGLTVIGGIVGKITVWLSPANMP